MKRKVVLGCSLTGLVLVLGFAAFLYVTVFRPAQSVMPDLDEMARLQEMNQGVLNQSSFLTPGGGLLTAEHVARFARVQTALRQGLGGEYAVLEERSQRLKGLLANEHGEPGLRHPGLRETILAFKGLGAVLVRAKELQVNALNVEGFSVKEYRWVRENVYGALGFSRGGVYLEDFAASLKSGKGLDAYDMSGEPAPRSPDQNRGLAAAYSDSVKAWYPFYIFGF